MKSFTNKLKFTLVLLFAFLISINVKAQERLSSITGNPEIKEYIKKNPSVFKKNKSKNPQVDLPFFDDFSYSGVYPDQTLWEDKNAYVNSTYALNPPSIGMATLDAIDSLGILHSGADYETPFIGDYLTSSPINLNYPGDESIYLSFFYCQKGLGENPDPVDSLILEFYSPSQDQWNTVWFSEGGENPVEFSDKIIKVESIYRQEGFRFRFKNYITLGSATYPSLAANGDHWHIDYVYLNTGRSAVDSDLNDLAFVSPLSSLLEDYESVPWGHYKNSTSIALKSDINITFKNNDNTLRLIDSLNLYLIDKSGMSSDQKKEAGTYQVVPGNQTTDGFANMFVFPENSNESASFELKARIVTDAFDREQNNTITYIQNFDNYYAYDDGSAEAGYGIYGSGTKYGTVAYKFFPEISGNVIGVNIYFTKTLDNASQKYFLLNLWEQDDEGNPEYSPTYQQEGVRPEYEDELNKFQYFEFDEPVAVDDTFYVGWTQTTEDMLNVGYDLNNISNDKLYYNISGYWTQSEIEGSLMIRPVFGTAPPVTTQTTDKIKVGPNPVRNENIIVTLPSNIDENDVSVVIFDMHGREVHRENNYSDEGISLSYLKTGVYIMKVLRSNFQIYTKKIIIIK